MYSVLIADDEEAVCQGLGVLIPWEDYGFKVHGYAFDGKEAFDKIKTGKFDLVITDIKMPKLDGLELLRLMRETGHNEKVVVISAYKEFEYAKKAIKFGVKDYILKPVDEEILINLAKGIHKELSEEIASAAAISQSRQVLKSSLLLKLVENGLDSDTINNMGNFNIEVAGEALYVCLAHINDNIGHIKGQLLEEIDGMVRGCCYGYAFMGNENRVCILVSFDRNNFIHRDKLMLEVFNRLNRYFPGSVILALGGRARNINEVKYSYVQACKVLKWALFNEKYHIRSYEQINWENDIKNTPFVREFEDLKNSMRAGERRTFVDQLEKFFLILQYENLSVELIYSLSFSLIYMLKEMIDEIGESSEKILGNHLIKSMDKMTMSQLQQSVEEAFINTTDLIEMTRRQSGNRVINRVLEYIDANYFKELTLKDLSEEFHLNYVYLGKLFTEVTGMHFPVYRNSIRIKHACKLLDTTDFKVYEVSEKVGYQDINYFYSIFKESMGISPNKYRRKHTRI